MRIRKIKDEELFRKFSLIGAEATELGRKQFVEKDSQNIEPSAPIDPYYHTLISGKSTFQYVQTEIAKSFFEPTETNPWVGWFQWHMDYQGKMWILKRLMAWNKNIPEWLFVEHNSQECECVYENFIQIRNRPP